MKKVLACIKAMQQRRAQVAFEAGFGWAMTQHHLHGVALEEIEMQIDGEPPHEFDYGAQAALRKLYSPR